MNDGPVDARRERMLEVRIPQRVVRAYKVVAIFVAAVGVGWFVYRVIADPGDSAAWIWLGFFVVAVCARGARVLSRQFRR